MTIEPTATANFHSSLSMCQRTDDDVGKMHPRTEGLARWSSLVQPQLSQLAEEGLLIDGEHSAAEQQLEGRLLSSSHSMWEYTTRGLKGPPEALISWKARNLAKSERAYHWAPHERIATGVAIHFLRVVGAAWQEIQVDDTGLVDD